MIFPDGKTKKYQYIEKSRDFPVLFLHGKGIESGRFVMKMVCYKLAVLNKLSTRTVLLQERGCF